LHHRVRTRDPPVAAALLAAHLLARVVEAGEAGEAIGRCDFAKSLVFGLLCRGRAISSSVQHIILNTEKLVFIDQVPTGSTTRATTTAWPPPKRRRGPLRSLRFPPSPFAASPTRALRSLTPLPMPTPTRYRVLHRPRPLPPRSRPPLGRHVPRGPWRGEYFSVLPRESYTFIWLRVRACPW
jgi:hypothetical protein